MDTDTLISIDDVTKRYGEGADATLAVEDVSLDIGESEFVSLVGPSGCGKTTLLHMVAGILDPTEGTITIDGTDVSSDAHRHDSVGLVFQQPVLLEWRTVFKNIMLPVQVMHSNGDLEGDMETYRERARELISLVGLEGFGDAYPGELSGGMQQRVTICQSLVYDPQVLLMDEPFGSLDALTKDQLNMELLRIWRETGKTILFITHDLDEAVFLSDRVIVLAPRPGRIVDEIEIDLERPRTEDTRSEERFHELTAQAYDHFRGD